MHLKGVRVVDLSRVLAGPLCTMMLGDLGASVIKVERPGVGDETRGWGPPFDERGESAYYLSINRNKLSLAADLADPADRALVLGLMAEADVVVENFRGGALSRLKIEPGELLEAHPRLLWCTISGFGPESSRPGYDFVSQAEMGWMAVTGEPDGPPMKTAVALADVITGKDAAIGVLAALHARERAIGSIGGMPAARRRIEVSLARSAAAALVNVAQNVMVSGEEAGRWGNAHANLVPYQSFDAADRPIVIAVGSDAQWNSLLGVIGRDGLESSSLATNAGRIAERTSVVAVIAERLRTRTAAEWHVALGRVGVPSGVLRTVLEVVRECGGSPLHGMPPAVGDDPRYPPPLLDEHGHAIRAAGWGAFDAG
jgi:crotonobetainyl-CoA:carnitine CoA-transferase CaiB-like acyl-CoA transferase